MAIQHWGSQSASRPPCGLRSLRCFVYANTCNGRRCTLRGVLLLLLLLVCRVRIEIDVNGGDLAIVVLLSCPLQSVEADLGAPRLNDNVGILQLLRGLNFILGESGVVETIVQSWVISVLNGIVRRAICRQDSIVPGGGGVIAVIASLCLPVAVSSRQRSGV